jgi:hypothetical protein
VLKVAVILAEDDAAEPLAVPELVALPALESVALAPDPAALAASEELEEAGAFGALAACACSRDPPQATAAHTIPIAIRRLTRFEALQN